MVYRMSRRVSILKVGGFRPTGDPFATHFGLKPLALPEEPWPLVNGAPMLFICQLNLTQAPALPESLKTVVLLTFFVDPNYAEMSRENGKDWQLRAYASLDGLVHMDRPADAPALKRGFECSWSSAIDDDLAGTKVGGDASTIQSELWWEYDDHPAQPQYCLQINSEEKVGLFWGDAGMVYIARGTAPGCTNQWFLDWQCY
jgi:uncharacterized protein YwqG